MANEIVLARLSRGTAVLDAYRWAVLREGSTRERPQVYQIDRFGVATERPTIAEGIAEVVPPPGHPVSVSMPGRRWSGIYGTEDVRIATGVIRPSETIRFWPSTNVDGVPGERGLATAWAKDVGLRFSAVEARPFALRFAVAEHRARWEIDGLGGAAWIDVSLAGHQLAVVSEVLSSPSIRHVLADEVGLGKTVEALMIWSALSTWNGSLRTLICCPKALIPQWCLEVRRRTERSPRAKRWEDVPPIYVPLGDNRVVDRLDTPNRRGLVVASHGGLEELARRKAQIDLLIVDEAHNLTSDQRNAVQKLARQAPHVLLLTATPHESSRRVKGAARARSTPFAWALSIVEPRCADTEDLAEIEERLERDLAFIEAADQALAASDVPSEALLRKARELERFVALTPAAENSVRNLVREATLMERVVRTRRRQIPSDQKASRRLVEVPIEYRSEELAVFAALRGHDSDAAAQSRIRRLSSSSWAALANDNVGLSGTARSSLAVVREARVDAKLEALLDLCARLWSESPDRKIVIRCEYSTTLDLVADRLRLLLTDGALRTTHENERTAWAGEPSVGPVARLDGGEDSILEALVDPTRAGTSMLAHLAAFEHWGPGGAVVLVARDVASVGLNLQFAHDLIFYDLPWQFGLAEQWIGRLDRLGQRGSEVNVYALIHPASPSRELLDLLTTLHLFESDARGGSDLDQQITRLIARADADEISWQQVMVSAARLFLEREIDDNSGVVLDLQTRRRAISADEERVSNRRVLRAFETCGFEVEHEKTVAMLRWPASKKPDAVELVEVRARLRSPEHRFGRGNPEALAMLNQWTPELRVDSARLSAPRWFRGGGTDFLTPRHPLLVESYDELVADPTLSLGCFRVRPGQTWRTGWFAIALSRTFPASAGTFLAWLSEALVPTEAGAPEEDEDLRQVFMTVEAGLQRACTLRFPPSITLHGWQLIDGSSNVPRELSADEVTELQLSLPDGIRTTASDSLESTFVRQLEQVEKQTVSCSAEMRDEMQALLDRAFRHVQLMRSRIVSERNRAAGISSTDASMRGIREHHLRRLALARTFFEKLQTIGDRVESALLEVLAPRVVVAALIEVSR